MCVTGEIESDPHWVYCSKFLFCCLSHLLMCLGKLNSNNFASPEEYQQALNTTNLLVRKAEMVFTSHIAYWSALLLTRTHLKKHNIISTLYLSYAVVLFQSSTRAEEDEGSKLLVALVVCVLGLVPVAVHQWGVHILHAALRLSVRQG